jgi:hypothetical protein
MRRVSSADIPRLSAKAMHLVASGIYSMYTLQHGEAEYLLITDQGERYFLDSLGGVLVSGYVETNIRSIVGEVVMLEGHSADFALVNCGLAPQACVS